MTDQELFEAAAKAAGLHYHGARIGRDYESCYVSSTNDTDDWFVWSPLTDDGDALRLAVKLGICTRHHVKWSQVFSPQTGVDDFNHDGDPYAATRRAIVRAAAAMATKEQS